MYSKISQLLFLLKRPFLVFRTRQTAQDFAAGLVLVSGEFKNLKIGMSRRCEFAMSVPSGSFVTEISVHRFFRVSKLVELTFVFEKFKTN